MREAIQEGLKNFREGGGFRTIGRRFVQAAPLWALFPGAAGFVAGEILPGLPDVVNPANNTTTLYMNEYGPQWAINGAELGVVVAVIDAVSRPFVIGAQIRRGERYEVPEMLNIFDHIALQTRSMVDRMRGRRQADMQDLLSSFYPPPPPPHEE